MFDALEKNYRTERGTFHTQKAPFGLETGEAVGKFEYVGFGKLDEAELGRPRRRC
jgi:hypothetical protein